jgi:hypothetical protein
MRVVLDNGVRTQKPEQRSTKHRQPGSEPLAVGCDIFATFISEIAKGPKPQGNDLIINGIEFAQGGNAQQNSPEDGDISRKRTLSWNQFAREMSNCCIAHIKVVQPGSQRLKNIDAGPTSGQMRGSRDRGGGFWFSRH